MDHASFVESTDATSAAWKYTQIERARVEFQFVGACGVVPILLSICILMNHCDKSLLFIKLNRDVALK